MNPISGVIRMYMRDRLGWLYLPWIILGSSFVVNLVIASISNEPLTTGGLSIIYIYLMILGMFNVFQSFPFAISFTVRRRDFVYGTLATSVGLSAIFSALILLLTKIERSTGGWGVDLTFFNLSYLNEGAIIGQWWVHFGFLIHLFLMGFVISSIHRKFGRTGLFTFLIGLSLVLTVAMFLVGYYGAWDDIVRWLKDRPPTAIELSTYLFPLTVLYAFASYLLLRKAPV